ncbi:MAG: TetR family transcriptional regulator, partial [Mycobacterium sp.]
EVFNEVGYAAAERGAIIERAGMTKGALYHHFDSMDSLTSAIIDEGSDIVLSAFRAMCESSSPALENMIHGTFAVAELFTSDKVARAAEQLTFAFGEFNEAAAGVYHNWTEAMASQASRAVAEGDLREDIDPSVISESIVGAMLGARLLSRAIPRSNHIERLTHIWELLLPVIATDAALPYFREFLSREALRQAHPALSLG